MKDNLRKNIIWNIIGTSFSAFNSLFFMIIVTRINGVDKAGVFTFAFSLACLFYVIGVYSGRTFQITDKDKNVNDSDYLYSKIFTCIIMLSTCILYCLIRGYGLIKFIIILELVLYKLLEAISESLYAVIQKNNELYKVGKSLFFKAIFSILFFILIDYFTKNVLISCLMIILFNLLFIIIYDIKNLKKMNFKLTKYNSTKIKALLKKGFFAFGFAFLTLYVINAPKYVIDYLLVDKYQTIFGIIAMPATVLILFGQYIIQPFIVMLKEKLEKNKKDFVKLTFKISLVMLVAGVFSCLVAFFIGIPLLELMYGIKLNKYLMELIIILLGATFYAISVVISTSLITMRNTFDQFIIFVVSSLIATVLSYILIVQSKVLGATLAYTITMFILLILYIVEFIRKVKRYENGKS